MLVSVDLLLASSDFDSAAFVQQRLRGITKSISRYPTYRRRFDTSMKGILEELARKSEGSGKSGSRSPPPLQKSKSMFGKIFSQKSFKGRPNDNGSSHGNLASFEKDIEIG